jgi:hypothetical protein
MFSSGSDLVGSLNERKIWVVGYDRFGESGKLDALFAQLKNLFHDFPDGTLAAIQYRADLHSSSSDDRVGGNMVILFHYFEFLFFLFQY